MKAISKKQGFDIAPLILPLNENEPVSEDNYVYRIFNTDTIGSIIKADTEYVIISFIIYDNRTFYLIDNSKDNIQFLPSDLFVITDNTISDDWRCYFYKIGEQALFAIGPAFLVGEYCSICDIMKNSAVLMSRFIEYKKYKSEWGITPDW